MFSYTFQTILYTFAFYLHPLLPPLGNGSPEELLMFSLYSVLYILSIHPCPVLFSNIYFHMNIISVDFDKASIYVIRTLSIDASILHYASCMYKTATFKHFNISTPNLLATCIYIILLVIRFFNSIFSIWYLSMGKIHLQHPAFIVYYSLYIPYISTTIHTCTCRCIEVQFLLLIRL